MSEHVIDPTRFRETLGNYPTGVVAVTALDADGAPQGMVIGSFASVSIDPPLVSYMPQRTSGSYQRLKDATSFVINVLAADQEDLCRNLAMRGTDKFEGVAWRPAPNGAPVLDGSVAWIECTPWATYDGGDHDIVLGRVTALDVETAANPLLFFQGGYGRFGNRALVTAEADLISSVASVEAGRAHLQSLADELDAEVTVIAAAGDELVYVASAASATKRARTALGTRFPKTAPLGELHLTGRGEDEIRAWAARSIKDDEQAVESQVVRARQAIARGWSASLSGSRPEGELRSALRSYSDPALTPAQHREVARTIAQATSYYQPIELEEGATYDLHSLMVAVPAPEGAVELVVRLSQLPPQAPAALVEEWLAAARRTVPLLAESVHGAAAV